MTGKKTILERIRKNKPEGKLLLKSFTAQDTGLSSDQLTLQFIESLKQAGAEISDFVSRKEFQIYIKANFPNTIDLRDPLTNQKYSGTVSNEELGKTEVVILEGQFGVAENGAIWLDETNFPNRLVPFVTQQLVILVSKTNIVSNMHEAYKKIDLNGIGFGVFISGPSKTADIEQSLVHGAHGPKKLTAIIY